MDKLKATFVEEKSPDPGTYRLPSDFDKPAETVRKGKMYSFGAGREAYDRVYYKERVPHDRQIPGPGTYEQRQEPGKNAKKFSLLSRIATECK